MSPESHPQDEPWNNGVEGEQVVPLINGDYKHIRVDAAQGREKHSVLPDALSE